MNWQKASFLYRAKVLSEGVLRLVVGDVYSLHTQLLPVVGGGRPGQQQQRHVETTHQARPHLL